MKLGVILVASFLLFLFGCRKDVERLPGPTEINIEAIDNGLGVRIRWSRVLDAEKYAVYFSEDRIAEVTDLFFYQRYEDIRASGLGSYFVRTIDADGRMGGQSPPVSTMPKEMVGQYLCDKDAVIITDDGDTLQGIDFSAYYWDNVGDGLIMPHGGVFHIYFGDTLDGVTDTESFFIASTNTSIPGREIFGEGDTVYITTVPMDTGIVGEDTILMLKDLDVVPLMPDEVALTYMLPIDPTASYYIRLPSNHYIRMDLRGIRMQEIGEDDDPYPIGIDFSYQYHPIKGFRFFEGRRGVE